MLEVLLAVVPLLESTRVHEFGQAAAILATSRSVFEGTVLHGEPCAHQRSGYGEVQQDVTFRIDELLKGPLKDKLRVAFPLWDQPFVIDGECLDERLLGKGQRAVVTTLWERDSGSGRFNKERGGEVMAHDAALARDMRVLVGCQKSEQSIVTASARPPDMVEVALADGRQFVFSASFLHALGYGPVSVTTPVVSPDQKRVLFGVRFQPEAISGATLAVTWSPATQCHPEVWSEHRVGAFIKQWPIGVDRQRIAEARWTDERTIRFEPEHPASSSRTAKPGVRVPHLAYLADTETGTVTRVSEAR